MNFLLWWKFSGESIGFSINTAGQLDIYMQNNEGEPFLPRHTED